MPITRARHVPIADAWGNDEGAVHVELPEGPQDMSVSEAQEFRDLLDAVITEVLDTVRLRGHNECAHLHHNEPAL
jgi:hypothetical protein